MSMLIPRPVREELNKAFGFLERDCPERALRCVVRALRSMLSFTSEAAQKACEERIQEFLDVFVCQERVRVLFENVPHGKRPIPYRLGQEGPLAVVLEGFARILEEQNQVTKEAEDYVERRKRQDYLWKMGTDYLASQQTLLAEAFFRRLLAEFPDDERYVLEAGEALTRAGCLRQAAQFYETVLNVQPSFIAAYSAALGLYEQLGQFSEALEVCRRVLKVFGEHPKTYTRMAQLYVRMEKPNEAQEVLRKALLMDPSLSEAVELEELLLREGTKLPWSRIQHQEEEKVMKRESM